MPVGVTLESLRFDTFATPIGSGIRSLWEILPRFTAARPRAAAHSHNSSSPRASPSPLQNTKSVFLLFRPSRQQQPASALHIRPPRHTPHRWESRLHWRHPPRPPSIVPRHAYCSHSVNDSLLREYSPLCFSSWARHPPPPTPTPTSSTSRSKILPRLLTPITSPHPPS